MSFWVFVVLWLLLSVVFVAGWSAHAIVHGDDR